MTYCTLADAIRHLRAGKSSANLDGATERQVLLTLLRKTPRLDNLFTHRGWHYFEPRVATIAFELRPEIVSSQTNRLQLPYPLLSLTSTSINGTAVSAAVLPADVSAGLPTPYHALYLTNNCYSWYNVACSSTSCARGAWVEVAGLWGMCREYSEAWQAEDSVQNVGGITAASTSITVTDADGANYEQETPRFSPGQLIRVGATGTDYRRVDAVNETTNVLTVRNGVNGGTAAAHAAGTAIYVFYPDRGVREEYARQVASWYSRIGAFNTAEVNPLTGGEIRFPADLLASLRGALQGYVYG